MHEAVELRDGEPSAYGGKGVLREAGAPAPGFRVFHCPSRMPMSAVNTSSPTRPLPSDPSPRYDHLAALEAVVAPDAILATNTSTLPVVEMAMETGRPDRVCGVHFFNPAPMMPLVEIVRAITRGCLRRDRKYLRALFRRRLALKLGFSKVLARYRALRDSAAEGKFP